MGNYHVRLLGGKGVVTPLTYPVRIRRVKMGGRNRFSRRHGFEPQDAEITVRQDAPDGLRSAVVEIAYEVGLSPKPLRTIICHTLRAREDPNNWSEFPNVNMEVHYRTLFFLLFLNKLLVTADEYRTHPWRFQLDPLYTEPFLF